MANTTWTAETYEFFEGKTVEDLNRLTGRRKGGVANRESVLDEQ